MPELRQKFEAVHAGDIEVDNVVLIRETPNSDLLAPYSVEDITQTNGTLIFLSLIHI